MGNAAVVLSGKIYSQRFVSEYYFATAIGVYFIISVRDQSRKSTKAYLQNVVVLDTDGEGNLLGDGQEVSQGRVGELVELLGVVYLRRFGGSG